MGKQRQTLAQRLRDAEKEWDKDPTPKKWRKKPATKRTLLLDNIVRTDTSQSTKQILQLDLFDPLNLTAHG